MYILKVNERRENIYEQFTYESYMNKHYLRDRQTNSLIPKLYFKGSIFGGGGSIYADR